MRYEQPTMKTCRVVRKPDMAAGEIPKAFVVLKKGMTVTEEEIMEFVKQSVAPSKAVREVEFRTSCQ